MRRRRWRSLPEVLLPSTLQRPPSRGLFRRHVWVREVIYLTDAGPPRVERGFARWRCSHCGQVV